jgi:hypothetical protein
MCARRGVHQCLRGRGRARWIGVRRRVRAPAVRLDLSARGLTIFTYTAEPGSKSEEQLNLLGSWAATPDEADTANATDVG